MQDFRYFVNVIANIKGKCDNKGMAKVISSYNTIFDNFSFHHSVSDIKNAPAEYHHETHSQFEILYLVDGEIKYKIEGEVIL